MNITFKELIDEDFEKGLLLEGIKYPTKIQAESIPKILEGKDCVLSSETGSGKTLAYMLPIFKKINTDIKKPQVIVITPTHELASQVYKQSNSIIKNCNKEINMALIVGGANIKRQIEKLKEKPNIIVGSMGRILELIRLKKISGHYVKTIVVDEADRMLDEANIKSLEAIVKTTLKDRQIIMVSATILDKDLEKSNLIMNSPEIIKTNNEVQKLPADIEHMYFVAERRDKIDIIRKIVNSAKINKGIVFINDPQEVEMLAKRLNYHNIKSVMLHGTSDAKVRRASLESFRDGTSKILVASDIAARGLDIKDATHVINFDVPEEGAFYLHRAGRVGRMGKKGYCITIAQKNEIKFLRKFQKEYSIDIKEKDLYKGEIIDKVNLEK